MARVVSTLSAVTRGTGWHGMASHPTLDVKSCHCVSDQVAFTFASGTRAKSLDPRQSFEISRFVRAFAT